MSAAYEELMHQMLEKVPGNVDKREGSVIFDALAPCAYFLAQQSFQIENFFDLVFPDTAVGLYLDRGAAMFGVKRKPAVKAVREMATTAEVDLGTRWGIETLVYTVTAKRKEMLYEVTCETAGEIGNQYSGRMQAISVVFGVNAELKDIVTPGTDEESDEALRERLYQKVRRPATSGNVYQYEQWALEVAGVGAVKVFPLDSGPGTVTVLVVNANKEIDPAILDGVTAHIEELRPIGAAVTVACPTAKPIDISAEITLDGSRSKEEVDAAFEAMAKEYLEKLIFENYRVSYARMGSLLLDVPGMADFNDFLLNGTKSNVEIAEKEIPVLGSITLTEVAANGTE